MGKSYKRSKITKTAQIKENEASLFLQFIYLTTNIETKESSFLKYLTIRTQNAGLIPDNQMWAPIAFHFWSQPCSF